MGSGYSVHKPKYAARLIFNQLLTPKKIIWFDNIDKILSIKVYKLKKLQRLIEKSYFRKQIPILILI